MSSHVLIHIGSSPLRHSLLSDVVSAANDRVEDVRGSQGDLGGFSGVDGSGSRFFVRSSWVEVQKACGIVSEE
jgi:hypothetical protein